MLTHGSDPYSIKSKREGLNETKCKQRAIHFTKPNQTSINPENALLIITCFSSVACASVSLSSSSNDLRCAVRQCPTSLAQLASVENLAGDLGLGIGLSLGFRVIKKKSRVYDMENR